MTTYHRVCIEDHVVLAQNGDRAEVTRGKEYLTSKVQADGQVIVFGQFWAPFPLSVFAAPKLFTGPEDEPAPHNHEVA